VLTALLVAAALAVAASWIVARLALRGADLSAFDGPTGERFPADDAAPGELQAVLAQLAGISVQVHSTPLRGRTALLRRLMDEAFADRPLGATFTAVDCAGVPGQWVQAPGADGARRTLYIHGGAFAMGSPRSHRTLTSRLAELTGGAVLAIDYRLMPEHRRMAGIEDCRRAYGWMLAHGPDGAQAAHAVFVAGDSAGGNLALSLVAWVRDQRLRLPDAVVALSPVTDCTLASPSLRANAGTDVMLGPLFGPLGRLPQWVLLWLGLLQTRINPRDPVVSPLRGDLSGLPPILLQACEGEMLVDDSRRYANRARAAGSPVRLQTWPHGIHAWQVFNPELTAARDALAEIGRFLDEAAPPMRKPADDGRAATETTT